MAEANLVQNYTEQKLIHLHKNIWAQSVIIATKHRYYLNLNIDEQIALDNIYKFITDILKDLNHYPYHNLEHTLDVYTRCEYLCDKEWIYWENRIDLLIGALFHDVWFLEKYSKNEEIAAIMAEEFLAVLNWRKDRIAKIKWIIMATVVGAHPNNKLEKMIQDADFDNLGRPDCLDKTMDLKEEILIVNNIDIPLKNWLLWTLMLFTNHKYNTFTSIFERWPVKKDNICQLEARISALI